MSATLDDVLDAQLEVQEAQDAVTAAISRRSAIIREALASGVGAIPLAEALGVNRQRVYAMAKQ